jgi:hypothetical protein
LRIRQILQAAHQQKRGAGNILQLRASSHCEASHFSKALPLEALDMPNDAKLGLVVGVGLVIAVAVIFFRKDDLTPKTEEDAPAATSVKPAPVVPKEVPRGQIRPTKAKPAVRDEENGSLETVTDSAVGSPSPKLDAATEVIER